MAKKNKLQVSQEVAKFLKHVNQIEEYWKKTAEKGQTNDPVGGAIFSMLVLLDGGDMEYLSGFDLIDRETGTNISLGYLHEIKNQF